VSVSAAERAARFGDLAWRFVDLSGRRFGRLLVLDRDGTDIGGHVRWHAQCDCGRRTTVDGTSLRLGRTRSCKCLMIERRRARWHAKMCRRNTTKFHRIATLPGERDHDKQKGRRGKLNYANTTNKSAQAHCGRFDVLGDAAYFVRSRSNVAR